MFVWVFHRVSGVLLIPLLAMQLFTGFYQASASSADSVRTVAALHQHTAINCVLVFLVIFHALYGLRTVLLDLGWKWEKGLFWACTAVGCVLFTAFLVAYFQLVAA